MRDESGQTTIEWVGLVLLAALLLGALAAFRTPQHDRELGAVVAKRITCAAGGACAERRAGVARSGTASVLPRAARGRPPESRLRDRRVPLTKATDAFRRLRGVGVLTKRVWIVCLGYRRFAYERDHPRAPTEPMPVAEALEIANTCLNPLAFLRDE
jgi:hypothetical protein